MCVLVAYVCSYINAIQFIQFFQQNSYSFLFLNKNFNTKNFLLFLAFLCVVQLSGFVLPIHIYIYKDFIIITLYIVFDTIYFSINLLLFNFWKFVLLFLLFYLFKTEKTKCFFFFRQRIYFNIKWLWLPPLVYRNKLFSKFTELST